MNWYKLLRNLYSRSLTLTSYRDPPFACVVCSLLEA